MELEAAAMEKAGEKVCKLNIGNPALFGLVPGEETLRNFSGCAPSALAYSEYRGTEAAREAILKYSLKKKLPNVKEENIFTGNGVSELIEIALDALLNPGDEVLVPSPDYPLWTASVTFAGGRAVHYLCDEGSDWYPDLQDMEEKITARTKAIVIINPNNPTGANYPEEILLGIAEIARRHNLIIFSDEIYDRLLFEEEHTSIAALAPDVLCVTMNGLSKSHMLCGYRVGWMVFSGAVEGAGSYIEGINMLCSMRLCSNVPGQAVIAPCLEGRGRVEEYFLEGGRIRSQVSRACSLLNEIPGLSCQMAKAAFYLFPKIDSSVYKIKDDREFAVNLLRDRKILIVPGSGFNWQAPDHFRIVCLPEEEILASAIEAIGEHLKNYR